MMDDETAENKQCRQNKALQKWCRSFFTYGKWLNTDTNGKPIFNELVAKEQSLQKLMFITYIL